MSAGSPSGRKGRTPWEPPTSYPFLLPSIAFIIVFGLWPAIHALNASLYKRSIDAKGSCCLPTGWHPLDLGCPTFWSKLIAWD